MKKKIFKYLFHTIGGVLPQSNYPFGTFAKKFRLFCAKRFVKKIGKKGNIEKGASIHESVEIGESSGIGIDCLLTQGVKVGNKVMMGPGCLVYTTNHGFNKDKKVYEGHTAVKPVVIEDNVWMGARCIILPGVTIGKGSTIGAGSVVTKDAPPYSVVAGNPAKVIKNLLD